MFDIIVATDLDNGIGKNGSIPWKFKKDMNFFKETTTASRSGALPVVIMGRKTWKSLPHKYLKDRANIVISTIPIDLEDTLHTINVHNFIDALQIANLICLGENIFVIGGGMVYKEAMEHPELRHIHKTIIRERFGCDTFFPEIDEEKFRRSSAFLTEENYTELDFKTYKRWEN